MSDCSFHLNEKVPRVSLEEEDHLEDGEPARGVTGEVDLKTDDSDMMQDAPLMVTCLYLVFMMSNCESWSSPSYPTAMVGLCQR